MNLRRLDGLELCRRLSTSSCAPPVPQEEGGDDKDAEGAAPPVGEGEEDEDEDEDEDGRMWWSASARAELCRKLLIAMAWDLW
jgi:hypothetical protein